MDVNMKHKEVIEWLKQVYGNENIPHFELSERSIEILHDLKIENNRRDREAELLLHDLQQKTEEYAIEAQPMAATLQAVGLPISKLSSTSDTTVKAISNIAMLLKVKDTSDTSLILGLMELSEDLSDAKDEHKKQETVLNRWSEKMSEARHSRDSISRSLEMMKRGEAGQRESDEKKAKLAETLQCKVREYRKTIKKLEKCLNDNCMKPELYHKNLVDKSKAIEELRKKLTPLNAKLNSYHQLPPNYSLAKAKLEEAKHELALLQSEISKAIDVMHM